MADRDRAGVGRLRSQGGSRMAIRPLGLVALGLLAAASLAGDVAAKEPVEVLRWRPTYSKALREARLRNVPVLITRHKDT